MPNPTNLLRRGRRTDPAELDAARSVSLARLTAIFDDGTGTTDEGSPPAEDVAAVASDGAAPEPAGAAPEASIAPADVEPAAVAIEAETPVIATEASEIATEALADSEPATADAASSEPDVYQNGHDAPGAIQATTVIVLNEDYDDAATPTDPYAPVPPPVEDDAPASRVRSKARQVRDESPGSSPAPPPIRPPLASEPEPSSPRPAARPRPARPPRAKPASEVPVAVHASCPYCALLLEPPPEADRRCARCRQRIIVKRVQGRAVYLTEAAVLVFDAERRRLANMGRWTRERERWLKLAASVEANATRIGRLERAILSDDVVTAARALYETTVERKVRVARRDRRWDDAARLRRDEALALYRAVGSPIPPPDDVLALHREGALAALRGLYEIAKEAALAGADCCDVCRADDGRRFRISRELRETRLPHAGCPKGLCRCQWDLTARDRNLVGDYLRRHGRSNRTPPTAELR